MLQSTSLDLFGTAAALKCARHRPLTPQRERSWEKAKESLHNFGSDRISGNALSLWLHLAEYCRRALHHAALASKQRLGRWLYINMITSPNLCTAPMVLLLNLHDQTWFEQDKVFWVPTDLRCKVRDL